MSMVMMPLLIKVKMTEENFKRLLREAVRKYYRSYLIQNYRYDGTYFTLDMCAVDNPGIFIEATNIARFTDCENEIVGLIYDEGPSYSVTELVFSKGLPSFKKYDGEIRTDFFREYVHKKEAFLNEFLETGGKRFNVTQFISTLRLSRSYICIAMTENVLETFFAGKGYHIESIEIAEGRVNVQLSDYKISAKKIIAQHYGCDDVLLLCTPDDFYTPDEYLLILIYFDKDDSRQITMEDYKAYHNRISALPNCNTCGIRSGCKFLPLPGQAVRINCSLWVNQDKKADD